MDIFGKISAKGGSLQSDKWGDSPTFLLKYRSKPIVPLLSAVISLGGTGRTPPRASV
jgi:hypothetical protein